MSPNQKYPEFLKDAATVWRALSIAAQTNSLFYDEGLLWGNEAEKGLYDRLQIVRRSKDFADDLEVAKVSVEQLVVAFFETLQPYALMMSDLCAFFQQNAVKETNHQLRIQFDFSAIQSAKLEFDLEHFRETLAVYESVKQLVEFYRLTGREAFELNRMFSPNYVASKAPWIEEWVEELRKGNIELLSAPQTGHRNLDEQLVKLFYLFNSFLGKAIAWGITVENSSKFKSLPVEAHEGTWDKQTVGEMMNDVWPRGFLIYLFHALETIEASPDEQQASAAASLAASIDNFLITHTVTGQKEDELLRQLEELLKLPVWKQRHELYSVWVLSLMDKVISAYPNYQVHQQNGILLMEFRPTLLCSFDTADGLMGLWSEMRLPHDNPVGHGRTAAIQPDYIFFKANQPVPEQASVVVEVKQYKTPSTRNFSEALNDYASGLTNAHVFLVNYGLIRNQMPLDEPDRCSPIGQVKPGTVAAKGFLDGLRQRLPPVPIPSPPVQELDMNELVPFQFNDWMLLFLGYRHIFVDISSSLNTETFRHFLGTILKFSVGGGKVGRLAAVDTELRGEWLNPTVEDVESLLELPFNGMTDFGHLVGMAVGSVLLITDKEGVQIARFLPYNDHLHVICFHGDIPTEYFTDQLKL